MGPPRSSGEKATAQHARSRLGPQVFLALDGSIPHDFTFGKSVSWQVVLADLLNDPTRAQRVTQAFLGMQKFDIELRLRA